MNNKSYKDKYIKYKHKYLELKQYGGDVQINLNKLYKQMYPKKIENKDNKEILLNRLNIYNPLNIVIEDYILLQLDIISVLSNVISQKYKQYTNLKQTNAIVSYNTQLTCFRKYNIDNINKAVNKKKKQITNKNIDVLIQENCTKYDFYTNNFVNINTDIYSILNTLNIKNITQCPESHISISTFINEVIKEKSDIFTAMELYCEYTKLNYIIELCEINSIDDILDNDPVKKQVYDINNSGDDVKLRIEKISNIKEPIIKDKTTLSLVECINYLEDIAYIKSNINKKIKDTQIRSTDISSVSNVEKINILKTKFKNNKHYYTICESIKMIDNIIKVYIINIEILYNTIKTDIDTILKFDDNIRPYVTNIENMINILFFRTFKLHVALTIHKHIKIIKDELIF